MTTFRNPLADPLGTRRGPPLVRGPQFENRWCNYHSETALCKLLRFLFVGAFQLVVDFVELLLVTFLVRLFVGLVLNVQQFHLFLHLLQILLTLSHRVSLAGTTRTPRDVIGDVIALAIRSNSSEIQYNY